MQNALEEQNKIEDGLKDDDDIQLIDANSPKQNLNVPPQQRESKSADVSLEVSARNANTKHYHNLTDCDLEAQKNEKISEENTAQSQNKAPQDRHLESSISFEVPKKAEFAILDSKGISMNRSYETISKQQDNQATFHKMNWNEKNPSVEELKSKTLVRAESLHEYEENEAENKNKDLNAKCQELIEEITEKHQIAREEHNNTLENSMKAVRKSTVLNEEIDTLNQEIRDLQASINTKIRKKKEKLLMS